MIPKFISKLKFLDILKIGHCYLNEILPQIGFHCHNFILLSAPYHNIGKDHVSALVDSHPELMYLDLHGGVLENEYLVKILKGCKQLIHLDVRNCKGFDDDDDEILELARVASHIR